MAQRFGIDFGTTNSVASVVLHLRESGEEEMAVLTNRSDQRPHPSVIWYRGTETIVGRRAKDALGELVTGASGDFVRSPKMLLGSPHGLRVGGSVRKAVDLASDIFKFIRDDALGRGYAGEKFDRAVVSIPVAMKGYARRELRQAALKSGIRIHQFVHEPLAALYGHLRGSGDSLHEIASLEGQLLLVFDWGGGTLDLTLCKVTRGALIQIANLGDSSIGGDQFDLRLERLVRQRHEKAHPEADWTKFQPTGRARLIQACEDAKIALSERPTTHLFATDVLAVQGEAAHVEVELTRGDLHEVTKDLVSRGLRRIEEVLAKADATDHDIEFCLATGGTVSMPSIREGLVEVFGPSRCRFTDNAATVISEGCAWIAHDDVHLTMAKSLSLLHAGDVFVSAIPSGTKLPCEGEQVQDSFSLYCVDPRDGFAKFLFGRSRWPEDEGEMIPYGQLAVRVDPSAKPLRERLRLDVHIDHDLIVTATARSEGVGYEKSMDIHDLEFGLGITPLVGRMRRSRRSAEIAGERGDIRIKGNVTGDPEAFALVPGELVREAFPLFVNETALQRDEKAYYLPCCRCNRKIHDILRDGCTECAENQPNLGPKQAEIRRKYYESLTAPDTWTNDTSTAVRGVLDSPEPDGGEESDRADPDLNQRKIETLGFSVRVTNCMKNNNVTTLGNLLEVPESDVSQWRSLGSAGLREIKTTLEGLGLSLK